MTTWTGAGNRPTGWVRILCRDGGYRVSLAATFRWTHTGEVDDIVAWEEWIGFTDVLDSFGNPLLSDEVGCGG